MSMMISPRYPDTKFDKPSIDDLIDVFEDRVRLWVLRPAKSLMDTQHGQIAGFCLVLTYFEGIWSYIEGRGSKGCSKEFFERGFVDVFRTTNLKEKLLRRVAGILYADARCGFFHDGMFRERICFTSLPQGEMLVTLPKKQGQVDEDGQIQSLLIDPRRFYSAIKEHFDRLISSLRDSRNVEERTKFQTAFKEQCDWETPGPVIGIPDPTSATT
ncbi:MAG: hypothetical protein ACE5JS_08020 [Nitrospinota bacterium]